MQATWARSHSQWMTEPKFKFSFSKNHFFSVLWPRKKIMHTSILIILEVNFMSCHGHKPDTRGAMGILKACRPDSSAKWLPEWLKMFRNWEVSGNKGNMTWWKRKTAADHYWRNFSTTVRLHCLICKMGKIIKSISQGCWTKPTICTRA